MATRDEVYAALDSERAYQDDKWGGRPHDDQEGIGNFLVYIRRYLRKAEDALTDASDNEQAMHAIRKVTALGVVAMEVHGAPRRKGY